MKTFLQTLVCFLIATSIGTAAFIAAKDDTDPHRDAVPGGDKVAVEPKLLRITATVDGSGKFVFTRDGVHYEHKNFDEPTDVKFDGEPWEDLSQTPPAWQKIVSHLDLTKARVVKRQGRDVIALELTPDGFDLYLCDSPDGADQYEVTIAIPRRP